MWGTCPTTAYVHPDGAEELEPILERPDAHSIPGGCDFSYRSRGYLTPRPDMRKLLLQDCIGFTWFVPITTRSPRGPADRFRLSGLGRRDHFRRA
ncbi:putative glycosyltransferase [Rhodococcus sp. AW25M09]|nr:putative glycosyltransferase [Rhodococcus sp. AW25M09]